MNITAVRSDAVYRKLMEAPISKRDDIYRYELMMPFEKKWACYQIPMKAAKAGGYDIIMASAMLGHIPPTRVDESQRQNIDAIADDGLWDACKNSIERSLGCFERAGIFLPVREYLYTILLANEESPYTIMNEGYCGDGGIPGYILAWLVPNEYTLSRLPVAIAHEVNHNIRYQFIKWRNDITLGEMLVGEGLAENFATWLYGEENAGPWVTKTDIDELNEYIKPIVHDGLGVRGLMEMNAYLYGDEMAAMQGSPQVGLPYCAGYSCGYHLIKHYLKRTGKSIVEATVLGADEILCEAEGFWDEATTNDAPPAYDQSVTISPVQSSMPPNSTMLV